MKKKIREIGKHEREDWGGKPKGQVIPKGRERLHHELEGEDGEEGGDAGEGGHTEEGGRGPRHRWRHAHAPPHRNLFKKNMTLGPLMA